MKLLLSTLFFIIAFISFTHAQTTPSDDLKALLPEGQHLARSFLPAQPELTPREKELQNKIVKAMMEHASWFRDSMKGPDDMDKMLGKLGLTPEEMEEYSKIATKSDVGIRITGTDSLEIIHSGNTISFHGAGASRPLDSLRIDLDANQAVFRGQIIPFKGMANPDHLGGNLKLEKAYEYSYEPAPDPSVDVMHTLDNLTRYMLYVGRMQTTHETMLALMVIKNVDKRMVLNINVPLLFK